MIKMNEEVKAIYKKLPWYKRVWFSLVPGYRWDVLSTDKSPQVTITEMGDRQSVLIWMEKDIDIVRKRRAGMSEYHRNSQFDHVPGMIIFAVVALAVIYIYAT